MNPNKVVCTEFGIQQHKILSENIHLRRSYWCSNIDETFFNIAYNVKSNKQFLIFTRTAWTRSDPPTFVNFLTRPDPTRGSTRPACNSEWTVGTGTAAGACVPQPDSWRRTAEVMFDRRMRSFQRDDQLIVDEAVTQWRSRLQACTAARVRYPNIDFIYTFSLTCALWQLRV